MTESVPVITLDGPSGVGKGTIAWHLATRLSWHLLDSGALYRLLALASARKQIALEDEDALAQLAAEMDVHFRSGDETCPVYPLLDGEPVGDEIRNESCGNRASRVARYPGVRKALLGLQHGFVLPPGLVADGRDMGTVVFPQAALKIFLSASPEARAQRRYKQLRHKGIDASLARLSEEIVERDERDRNRAIAPLIAAADAIDIDTTMLDIDGVLARVMEAVQQSGL